MSRENEKTLEVYDKLGKKYIENTIVHDEKDPEKAARKRRQLDEFLKESFSSLAKRDKIFDIGSGGGENAEFLASLGYRVVASDVSEQFLDEIRKKGLVCRKFNAITDDFGEIYDGVLAWRVFVHFTPEDMKAACEKIYRALRLGGIFVCNVLNKEAHGGLKSGWYDFNNEYYMGAERFYQYYDEETAREILLEAGFSIRKMFYEGGHDGDKWIVFVLERPTGMREGLREYIGNEILPQYEKLSGHTSDHVGQVISGSFEIITEMEKIDASMAYVIAAYHDLGRLINDDTHNIESGKMLAKDKNLRRFFTDQEIKIMIEAVEDHRASLKGDPRSIYGKIVSTADRDMNVDDMLERSYDYTKLLHPEMSDDEVIEEARVHLREKFSPDGYGAKKMYFKTADSEECFIEIERLTRDPAKYLRMMKEFNKKRGV